MTSSSTSDLVSRVLAKIDEAERIARTVTNEWSAWYVVGVERGPYGLTYQDIGRTLLAELVDHRAVLRYCAADRDLIAEVAAWAHRDCEDSHYACPQATLPGCADPCDCGTTDQRDAVLRGLARRYGLTPEEN